MDALAATVLQKWCMAMSSGSGGIHQNKPPMMSLDLTHSHNYVMFRSSRKKQKKKMSSSCHVSNRVRPWGKDPPQGAEHSPSRWHPTTHGEMFHSFFLFPITGSLRTRRLCPPAERKQRISTFYLAALQAHTPSSDWSAHSWEKKSLLASVSPHGNEGNYRSE